MSANSFNKLVDGLTLTLGEGQVGHYKGRGAKYRVNTAELLKDIEKVSKLIREKGDNLMTGKSKQRVANVKRLEEYPKLLDALIRMVPEEDMPRVEAIMAKVNGPQRGRSLVAAAVAAGSPGRSVSRGRSAPREAASAAAAPAAAKAKTPSPWNEHVKLYAASHVIPYAQALRNSRNTYVPVEKAAAAAAPYNPFNNNALYTNAVASAAANPFNMFKAVPGAAAAPKNKTKRTRANPFNMFKAVPGAAAAAAPKNKTKRHRAKGPWNVLVAEVQAANPRMPRANVMKLASKQMGIRKNSPLSEFGPLGLNNSNNNA